MAADKRRYTVEECLSFLDDDFDIPEDGFDFEFEGLDDDDDDPCAEIIDITTHDLTNDEPPLRLSDFEITSKKVQDEPRVVGNDRGRPAETVFDGLDRVNEKVDIEIPNFMQHVGPTKVMPKESTELDFFLLFIDNRILSEIVRETNRYAEQSLEAKNKDSSSWDRIELQEMKAFFGLLIAMSMHKVPWLRDYWSDDWILGVPAFAQIMTRNRFFAILNNLHLADNSLMPQRGTEGFDKLYKVRSFINNVRANFLSNYDPHREQAIDEAMIKYKGRTTLKQYMPMKPIKRGIKMWCRADSKNGYLCDFDIYTGKQEQGIQYGLGYSVVTRLCKSIKGHWYAVFFDNFFTSYKLIEDLYSGYKILSCGTLRSGRVGFPQMLFDKTVIKSMNRGEVKWSMKGPVLALTWIDKRPVHMAGTYTKCPQDNMPTVERKKKDGSIENVTCPEIVINYNSDMGGVDRNDQMKSYYPIPVTGKKWWVRIFFDVIDRSIHNAYILYQESPSHAQQIFKDFRVRLAKQLIGNFSSRKRMGRPSAGPSLKRHRENHFPELLPTSEKGQRKEQRCKVCYEKGNRKQTIYFCSSCDIGLCPAPCFKDFHSL